MYEWYAKFIETVTEIDALLTALKALVLRHPECQTELGEAVAAVVKALPGKSVTGMLLALNEVREAYAAFVTAYTTETAAGAVSDLVAKLKSIAE
jgi:hypothetical protein